MVNGNRIERLVLDFDKQLQTLENDSLRVLLEAIDASYATLSGQIRRNYSSTLGEIKNQSFSFKEARARALLAQLEPLLDLTRQAPNALNSLTLESYQLAFENALEVIQLYAFDATIITPIIRTDVAIQAANARARLLARGKVFADKATSIIIQGIVKGQGFRKTARELKEQAGVTKRDAERIVRTESIAASDKARKDRYKERGIEGEQLITTADKRVCGFCASRAGNVYKIGELVLPLHPHDRCYLAPWRQSWHDKGLTDDEWYREHRTDAQDRSDDELRRGVAPLEKARGLSKPPTPIWTP